MKTDFPTYLDLKYVKSSKIFESELIKDLSVDEIREAEKTYNILVEKLQKGEEIDEGLFGGILAAGAGFLGGPLIGKALCKVLGVDENSPLGKLLTSRLIATAIGYTLGK
jgi:hypothetical protein